MFARCLSACMEVVGLAEASAVTKIQSWLGTAQMAQSYCSANYKSGQPMTSGHLAFEDA